MAGSTNFPGSIDDFAEASPTKQGVADSTGRVHSERHDDMEAAMEAVQTRLLSDANWVTPVKRAAGYVYKTADYTVTPADDHIDCLNDSAAITITLYSPYVYGQRRVTIRNGSTVQNVNVTGFTTAYAIEPGGWAEFVGYNDGNPLDAAWLRVSDSQATTSRIVNGAVTSAKLASAVWSPTVAELGWSSAAIDALPRWAINATTGSLNSGVATLIMFTPLVTVTVSQLSSSSGTTTAASGTTLARMGIFTWDESTATLVARTASDTNLWSSTSTIYTRSLDTTGGYPASYQLVAGTRYALGCIFVGSQAPNMAVGPAGLAGISSLEPALWMQKGGQSDLSTIGSWSGVARAPWMRAS